MRKFPYFKIPEHCCDDEPVPLPLSYTTTRSVRFEEVDPLNIVWHGRYPSYFEDGRVAFGKYFNLNYLDMYREDIIAPIKEMHIDYIAPLFFDEECTIKTTLYWSDASRMNFAYAIYNSQHALVTQGSTVQLFLNTQGELYMAKPEFFANFCERWKNGEIQ